MNRRWRARVFSSLLVLGCGVGLVTAQSSTDEAYTKAVTTIYAVSKIGGFVKQWCDDRAPQTKAVTAQGLAAWRTTFKLDEVDARMRAVAGNKWDAINASLEAQRAPVYQGLDGVSREPVKDCQGIEAYLNSEVNPKTRYPDEYALTFSRPLEASSPAPVSPAPANPPIKPNPPGTASASSFKNLSNADVVQALRSLGVTAPIRPGGALKFGAYRCGVVFDYGSRQSASTYTLNIYTDRGLRLDDLKSQGKPGREFVGSYTYNAATGELEASSDYDNYDLRMFSLTNGTYNSVTENRTLVNAFVFLSDAQGTAFFYGQQEYGSTDSVTGCRYAGAPRQASPVELTRQAEARRIAERDRYRTKPNQGLKIADIEGIVHDYKSVYQITGMQAQEETTLLLKDGAAYTNLRYTPHDLNVGASKKGEPKFWTRWRRAGATFELLNGNQWQRLEGFLVQPGGKNERINGYYQFMSTYTVGTADQGTTSITDIGFTFSGDQFVRSGGNTLSGNTVSTFAYATSSKSDRGTYTFDGYTLELRYDDGQVNRTFGYYWDKKKDSLVIGGTTYSRPR